MSPSFKRFEYATSAPIDEMIMATTAGPMTVLRKDLSPSAVLGAAQVTKPEFLLEPAREIAVYRTVLPAGLGSPACYGSWEDPAEGRFGLLLEKIDGLELWQIGELDVWADVAEWLAAMHAAHLERRAPARTRSLLVHYDADYYREWPRRALAFAPGRNERRTLERIVRHHDAVIDQLLALPHTFIHGELYPSNVLVGHRPDGAVRVAAVDWETAAVGPALVDLAALVAGWPAGERERLVAAYRAASPDAGGIEDDRFTRSLDACRLHLCLRWLGWAPGWIPPREHAHDWLTEAAELASGLER